MLSVPVWGQDYSPSTVLVDWLNEELAKSSYPARVLEPTCTDGDFEGISTHACTYTFDKLAYVSFQSDKRGIVSFEILTGMVGEDFERTLRESLYIYSLIVWTTLGEKLPYSEAQAIVVDLDKRSIDGEPAMIARTTWSYGISEIENCRITGRMLVLVATRTRTGVRASDIFESATNYKCGSSSQ